MCFLSTDLRTEKSIVSVSVIRKDYRVFQIKVMQMKLATDTELDNELDNEIQINKYIE